MFCYVPSVGHEGRPSSRCTTEVVEFSLVFFLERHCRYAWLFAGNAASGCADDEAGQYHAIGPHSPLWSRRNGRAHSRLAHLTPALCVASGRSMPSAPPSRASVGSKEAWKSGWVILCRGKTTQRAGCYSACKQSPWEWSLLQWPAYFGMKGRRSCFSANPPKRKKYDVAVHSRTRTGLTSQGSGYCGSIVFGCSKINMKRSDFGEKISTPICRGLFTQAYTR